MEYDDLERILSEEKEILPSSGFVASVMEAVTREAATPPPIPFPWKRALPGSIVLVVALVWAFIDGIRQVGHGSVTSPLPASFSLDLTSVLQSTETAAACWIALALILSFTSVKLSLFLVRRTTV